MTAVKEKRRQARAKAGYRAGVVPPRERISRILQHTLGGHMSTLRLVKEKTSQRQPEDPALVLKRTVLVRNGRLQVADPHTEFTPLALKVENGHWDTFMLKEARSDGINDTVVGIGALWRGDTEYDWWEAGTAEVDTATIAIRAFDDDEEMFDIIEYGTGADGSYPVYVSKKGRKVVGVVVPFEDCPMWAGARAVRRDWLKKHQAAVKTKVVRLV
jgi:hypothetical protein